MSALSTPALALFRQRAQRSGRVDADVLLDADSTLLENLHLLEGAYLKRAALLLFHPTPERFVTGVYLKIGRFATDDDLRYQDEVHSPLMDQIEKGSLNESKGRLSAILIRSGKGSSWVQLGTNCAICNSRSTEVL